MRRAIIRRAMISLAAPLLAAQLSGCASLMSSVTNQLAADLTRTILNSNDPETVRLGVPAYILMVDSFLLSDPDNESLLLAASSLNGAFTNFATPAQAGLLATKSLDYASHAVCLRNSRACGLRDDPFATFRELIDKVVVKDVDVYYQLGVAWAGWIQAHSGDWNAIAQLDHVRHLMQKLIELDEGFDNGGAHLYLGGLDTLLPAALGGKPEKGRAHFERAIALSGGQFLMTKVIYAQQYARLTFDKVLHDKLLNEVIAADPQVEGMTLVNVLAQQRATVLLADSDDYF